MIKKVLLLAVLIYSTIIPAFASRIPVKITPTQIISTNKDEIEVGDWIQFVVVNDVKINGELYLKRDTQMTGVVDFIHPNGWFGDSAQVTLKTFYATDSNNKKITINSPLIIDGTLKEINDYKDFTKAIGACLSRGQEIFVEPDTKTYNIFMEQ